MKSIKYHKLVRDGIPQIIEKCGKTCITSVLPEVKYIEMLDKKLNEELAEYQESKTLEESISGRKKILLTSPLP